MGLSKLARTVDVYAKKTADSGENDFPGGRCPGREPESRGVMVMIEAEHTCMTMRGIKKPGSKTVTTVARGAFKDDFELQKMFMQMVKG